MSEKDLGQGRLIGSVMSCARVGELVSPSRRGFLGLLTGGIAAVALTPRSALATPGLLAGRGDFSRLRLENRRTGEKLDVVYRVGGHYLPDALDEVNFILRDWRQNLVADIDVRTLDILAKLHKLLDTEERMQIISGYRSPATNAMLREKGGGVARNSYHMKGMATDVRFDSRSVTQVFNAAWSLQLGGCGKYSGSDFVHVDCAEVRKWGR